MTSKGRAAVMTVLVAMPILCAAPRPAMAQIGCDMLTNELRQAQLADRAGDNGAALQHYEGALDIDLDADERAVCGTARATAGLGKGLALLKMNYRKDAIEAFQDVLRMREAPDVAKDAARRTLDRLR